MTKMKITLLLKVVFFAGLVSSCNSIHSQPVQLNLPDMEAIKAAFWESRAINESSFSLKDSLRAWEGGRIWWLKPDLGNAGDACVEQNPCSHLARVLEQVSPGDVLILREGIYRESIKFTKGGEAGRPLRIIAYPGERVVITGADPLKSDWQQANEYWRHSWDEALYMHRSKQRPQQAFRPEMLIYNGNPLLTVYTREELKENHFWVEGEPEAPVALYASFPGGASPIDGPVEVGRRAHLLGTAPDAMANHVHVRGIAFLYSVISGKDGCVQTGGSNWVLEDNLVAGCNGLGIMVKGEDHVLRRNWAIANGQMGWATETSGSLLEDNRSEWNNWKGYDAHWEAGGGKFKHTSNTIIRRHYAAHNEGPGIWLDIENENNLVEDALVVNNQKAGIMLEYKTTGTTVRNNVVFGTRILGNAGSGIQVQAASGNIIENNTIFSNHGDGIRNKLHDNRAASGGNTFRHNVVVNNGLGHTNAQEVRVEGDLEAAQTDTYAGNVFGAQFAGNEVFMIGTYSGNKLERWLRLSESEDDQVLSPVNVLQDVTRPEGWRLDPASGLQGVGKQTPTQ